VYRILYDQETMYITAVIIL